MSKHFIARLLLAMGVLGCIAKASAGGLVQVWGSPSMTNVPATVTNVTAIAAGSYHTIVINDDGTVSGWGDNSFGKATAPAGLINVMAIAAGGNHNLAVRRNGRVVAWGDNSAFQTNVPPNLSNVVAVAAGDFHSLALRSDGIVVGWGANNSGQAIPPGGLGSVIAIAAGGSHSLALRSDGSVVAWGQNTFGESAVPPGLSGVIAIAAGSDFSLALRNNGSIVAWGNPALGRTSPPFGFVATGIAAGAAHGLAIASGNVVAWGDNSLNQSVIPAGMSNVVAVSAGSTHSVALKLKPPRITTQPVNQTVAQGGTATFSVAVAGSTPIGFRWRLNGTNIPNATNTSFTINNAQLANMGTYSVVVANAVGSVTSSNATLTVNVAPSITQQPQSQDVAAGTTVTFAVTATGTNPIGYRWRKDGTNITGGFNSSLILSNVQLTNAGNYTVVVSNAFGMQTSAVAVLTVHVLPAIVNEPQSQSVLIGTSVTLDVLATNATAYQWKKDNVDIPGATSSIYTINSAQPAHAGTYTVQASNPYGSVTSHPATLTVVTSPPDPASPVVLWGEDPVWTGMDYIDNPVPAGLSNVVAIAAGWYHNLVLFGNGRVLGWGDNFFGQSGSPAAATNLVQISAGMHHSIGRTSKGTVIGWGRSDFGQLGVPASASNIVAISAGAQHNLALRADGKVISWGLNIDGQVTIPSTVTNATAIAAGAYHSLALLPNTRVAGWGRNDYGQRSPPTTLSNVVALAAGDQHSIALKSDGTVVVWGNNNFNQLNIPPSATDIVAIAAGANHNLALRRDGAIIGWGQNNFGQTEAPGDFKPVAAIAAKGARSLALRGKLLRIFPPRALGSNRYQLRIGFADGSALDSIRAARVRIYYSNNPLQPRQNWTLLNIPLTLVNGVLVGEDNAAGSPRFYVAGE